MHDGSAATTNKAELAALRLLCESAEFKPAEQMQRLLTHIVSETLAGNTKNLMAKNLAIDVFGTPPAKLGDLSAVRVEIGRLRRRLQRYYATEGANDPMVIDIPKGGYVASFTHRESLPEGRAARTGKLLPWTRRLPRRIALPISIVLLVGVFAVLALSANMRSPSLEETSRPRLVVAPISALDDSAGMQPFSQGLAADIINRLVRFQHMIVVSRQATTSAPPGDTDHIAMAARISADYLLHGMIRGTSPKGPRVNLELVRVSNGEVVWVGEYFLPESDTDVFTAQLDIANEVAQTLAGRSGNIARIEIGRSEAAASRPSYVCVLNYYAYLSNRSPARHLDVRKCLEDATSRSPDYAEVWTSLANVYLDEARNRFNPEPEAGDALERAHASALKGTQLTPESASALSVLAAVEHFRGDLDEFREAARRSIEANTNDVDVLGYMGHLLSVSGEWDEGQKLLNRAKEMSPVHSPLWHHSSSMAALLGGDYETALSEAERGEVPSLFLSYMLLSAAHGYLGNSDQAAAALSRLEELRPGYPNEIESDLAARRFSEDIVRKLTNGLALATKISEKSVGD